ncbi:unnamed protein product [Camellia sinensis]
MGDQYYCSTHGLFRCQTCGGRPAPPRRPQPPLQPPFRCVYPLNPRPPPPPPPQRPPPPPPMCQRPSVIPALLASYDAKRIRSGFDRDRVVSEHVLYRTHKSI